jgi:hypothetical protein
VGFDPCLLPGSAGQIVAGRHRWPLAGHVTGCAILGVTPVGLAPSPGLAAPLRRSRLSFRPRGPRRRAMSPPRCRRQGGGAALSSWGPG